MAYQTMVRRSVVTRRLNSKADLKLLKRYMEFSDEFGGYATKDFCPHFNLRRGFRLLETCQPSLDHRWRVQASTGMGYDFDRVVDTLLYAPLGPQRRNE